MTSKLQKYTYAAHAPHQTVTLRFPVEAGKDDKKSEEATTKDVSFIPGHSVSLPAKHKLTCGMIAAGYLIEANDEEGAGKDAQSTVPVEVNEATEKPVKAKAETKKDAK